MSMDIAGIEKKVLEVLADKASMDPDEITLESSLVDDLGLDSLDAVEIVFEFEEGYGIDIPDERIKEFRDGRDILNYLVERLRSR
jgi:acyl carrier protein